VGIPSIIIIVVYLAAAWLLFRFERKHPLPTQLTISSTDREIPIKVIYLKFALAAGAVIGAGIWLSLVGDEIALVTGWGASFVGSLFLAITTSLPELVVAVAALRLGAIDMAVADVLGANMLDMVTVIWTDLAYTSGPILTTVSSAHFTTAIVAIAMTVLVIIGLHFRQKRKVFVFTSWYSPLLVGLYIFGAYVLFSAG
jgi:cation:H+ antiporter